MLSGITDNMKRYIMKKGGIMKISIIGAAGTLGSCTAFNIITHRIASELVLLDPWKDGLKAQFIDLNTAITWQSVRLRMGEDEDLDGSDIVIITAGVSPGVPVASRRELLPGNLPLIKEIAAKINLFCPEAVVITATNPVDPLNYAMYLLSSRRNRRKIIGYSLNDTFRFRNLVAEALGVTPIRIDGIVIGEHDASQVLVFSSLRLDGKPIDMDQEFKQKIYAKSAAIIGELESLRPRRATGWTSAVGMVAMIRSIIHNVGESLPCNAVLDGEYGYSGLSMTVPTELCQDGIEEVQEIALTPDEKQGLAQSASTLKPMMKYVEDILSKGGPIG
jgi:malate dehydrogenase